MSRKHYSPEFREQLVALARSGRSLSSLAREFEPSVQTRRLVIGWRRRTVGR